MDPRVRAAINFMNTNLERGHTSIEIAKAVRLSPTHLRRLFKSETGQSILEYRKQLQLERATHLLETTFSSVKEIAAIVGLNEVSHFARDFKKAYGLRPSEYAQRHRKR